MVDKVLKRQSMLADVRWRTRTRLMDVDLPGMSGVEVLEHLRADESTRDIPIIALSANAMPGDIRKGLDAGFIKYLTKPIKIDEVVNAIKECLG